MSVTAQSFLTDAGSIAEMVASVFQSWKDIIILDSPNISLNDILLGGAWVGITLNWINRLRAPKVTNG